MLSKEEFVALLKSRGTLVIDGALATELEVRGLDLNHPLWSAKILKEQPDIIRDVHLDYFIAGADIAITASYQANTQGLYDHFQMSASEAEATIKQSVYLAQEARDKAYSSGEVPKDRQLLVAGSVGPYGAFLSDGSEYRGDYDLSKAEYFAFHRPRFTALIDAGVDLLAIETIPSFPEIEALLDLLHTGFSSAIAWIGMTLKDAQHISDGTDLAKVVLLIQQHPQHIVAFGINCVSIELVEPALKYLASLVPDASSMPLLCYPNSGEIWDAKTKTWSGGNASGEDVAGDVRSWRSAGARLIGGCCRTGPEYVKIVSKTLRGD